MSVLDCLSPEAMFDVIVKNKRSLLELLAMQASVHTGRPKSEIFEALEARERLGSTALGKGVALPHARLPGGIEPFIFFVQLSRPIDFEARDAAPVDLVFLMLWPTEESKGHIKAMSELCRTLRDPRYLNQLRVIKTSEGVVQALRGHPM